MNQVRLIKCLWYAKKIVKLCLGIYIFVKENKGNILCNVTVVRYLSWQPQEQRALFSSGSFGFQIECLCRLTRTTVDGDKTKSTRVVVGFMQLSEQRRTKKEKTLQDWRIVVPGSHISLKFFLKGTARKQKLFTVIRKKQMKSKRRKLKPLNAKITLKTENPEETFSRWSKHLVQRIESKTETHLNTAILFHGCKMGKRKHELLFL